MSRHESHGPRAGLVSSLVALGLAQAFVAGHASAQCVPAPAGLVAWWDADAVAGGIATDLAGGNDGTLLGDTGPVPGVVGHAFGFDGIGDAVVLGSPSALHLQDLTISAWVRRASATQATLDPFPGSTSGVLFAFGQNGYGFAMRATGELVLTKIGISGVISTTAVTDTAWHHIAVSKAGGTVTFYLDGVAEAFSNYDPGFTFATDAAIGARGDNLLQSFLGEIDEVQVFDRGLSSPEIQWITDAGASGVCKQPPTCAPTPLGLTGWWTGDSIVGSTALDTGGENDGQLANGASTQPGYVGAGLAFDGIDDTLTVGDAPELDAVGALTIAAWVRPTGTVLGPSSSVVVADKSELSSTVNYRFGLTGGAFGGGGQQGKLFFFNRPGVVFSGGAIPTDEFSFVALTVDGTTLRFYVHGALDSEHTIGLGATNNAPLRIGHSDPAVGGFYFGGIIDELQLFDRSLSEAEIAAIYLAGSAGVCSLDSDADGLTDAEEANLGTDPNEPDSDHDGLLDGTEIAMQTTANPGCPDPLNRDSDADTLFDGAEVALGTSPCDPDTDGDTIPDAIDPLPTDPGITSGVLEDTALGLAAYIETRVESQFDAPNANARLGRRNSLASRVRNAAKKIRQGQITPAIALLQSVGERVDGDPQQRDWMLPSTERDVIQLSIQGLIGLMTP